MSERELREHMHDLWDALYVRLRATSPERASQVRSHHRFYHDHQHFIVTAADVTFSPRPLSDSAYVFGVQGASDMLRRLPLKLLQVGSQSSEFLVVVCVTIFLFQEIVLDTKTELTMEGVERWLDTAETAETQGGAAASSSGRYLPTSTMEEVE